MTTEERLEACTISLLEDFRNRSYAEVRDDYEWMINALYNALQREKILREALVHISHEWPKDKLDEFLYDIAASQYSIAKEALAKVKEIK